MRTEKIIIILVMILTFSCQDQKKDSEIEPVVNIEIPKTVNAKKEKKIYLEK